MQISLAAARVNKGLTQEQTARAVGVSKGTYSNYENGKTSPPVEVAGKLADLFGIPITCLRFSK